MNSAAAVPVSARITRETFRQVYLCAQEIIEPENCRAQVQYLAKRKGDAAQSSHFTLLKIRNSMQKPGRKERIPSSMILISLLFQPLIFILIEKQIESNIMSTPATNGYQI